VEGSPAEQRHVLTAEDVILMAWAAPEPARSRLSAFASDIWSRLPSVAPSEHLTALIKLDLRYSSQTNAATNDPRVCSEWICLVWTQGAQKKSLLCCLMGIRMLSNSFMRVYASTTLSLGVCSYTPETIYAG